MRAVYARTRLDALRQLRREGYAVVDRAELERLRQAAVTGNDLSATAATPESVPLGPYRPPAPAPK